MRSSGFVVRKFRSAAMERAFRMDYARRYAGQRRLAGASLILIWIVFVGRDWFLLNTLDPNIFLHVVYVRLAGAVSMAVPVWLMWGPRAFDERWAVGLLYVVTMSCWFALLALVKVYPVAKVGQEIFPGFFVVLFLVFTLFRLRAITAAWLVGLCVVTFNLLELDIEISARSDFSTMVVHWFSLGAMVFIMYLAGIAVCIQFERAARREFVFRRTLRAAKARIEAASRVVNDQNRRMQELIREKERFFSSAYHDIQQPLAAINLFIRSARTRIRDGYAVDRELDVIEETASDILDMFKDIQDYSELGSYVPHVVPVDTHGLLTEVFEQYRETARLRGIDLRIAGRRGYPPSIETDRSLFKRSVSNLVSNAIKNTSSGGVVLGWVQLNERLRVDVWDTGIGIAPAHRGAIFSEYFQINNPGRDRSKGLGLGLSIVHRAIHILPGHGMNFASVEGRGSRFSLYATVSASTPTVGANAQDGDVYTPDLTGTFMLLCDDEPAVLEGLRRLFSSAGALVHAAESMAGFEAILADDSRIPDLIVADIRLREGATGMEVADRIRRHFAWAGVIPVAFITGELLSDHVLRDFPEPFVLLRKSSAAKDLLTEISRYVSAQRKMK